MSKCGLKKELNGPKCEENNLYLQDSIIIAKNYDFI